MDLMRVETLEFFLGPALWGLAVFLAGLIARPILFKVLSQWAARTRWGWDNLFIQALRGPFLLWCLMASLYVAVVVSPADSQIVQLSGKVLTILWVVSLTVVALRLTDQLIQRYGMKLSVALPLTSLTQNLARGVVLAIGGLVILNNAGVSITPLLTALGVGGLAVALALQETLTSLFSGIYITVARKIRVGDYIKLESGEEGYVVDIAWRSTRLRTLSNNLIIVPNTKLAQAIVTNYDLPNPDLAVLVEVGVDYRSDLGQAERAACEVAKEVMQQVPGGVANFEPFIRYHTFGGFGIQFTVILRAKSFVDQYLIKHEFVKRLHSAFAKEGISFPTQKVLLEGGEK